jgi:tetratricopeptide (TPR) repeat protein
VARELGVRYVLEGSVRKSAERVRISAQLIDAGSGNQLFANRRDFDPTDILAMQDQIAEWVAGTIEPELLKAEANLGATRLRASDTTGWDLARQGIWHLQQATKATYLRARQLLRQACNRDPDLPEGHIWLAHVSAGMLAHGWSNDPASDGREGVHAALRAVQIDEKSPYSHYALAISSAYQDALEQAVRAAESAVELCPSFALGHLALGLTRLFSGDACEAIAPLERGLQLNPYDPQTFLWYHLLALAHFFDRRTDAALQCVEKALKIRPMWPCALQTAACCCVVLGRAETARQSIEQMARSEEAPSDVLAPLKRRNPWWSEEMVALLRKVEARP